MIPSNQPTDLSISTCCSGLVLEQGSGGRAMLLPHVLGRSKHFGLCLLLSYVSPLPIFAQGIKVNSVFMILSY